MGKSNQTSRASRQFSRKSEFAPSSMGTQEAPRGSQYPPSVPASEAPQYPPSIQDPNALQYPRQSYYSSVSQYLPSTQDPNASQYPRQSYYSSVSQYPPPTQDPNAPQYPPQAYDPKASQYPPPTQDPNAPQYPPQEYDPNAGPPYATQPSVYDQMPVVGNKSLLWMDTPVHIICQYCNAEITTMTDPVVGWCTWTMCCLFTIGWQVLSVCYRHILLQISEGCESRVSPMFRGSWDIPSPAYVNSVAALFSRQEECSLSNSRRRMFTLKFKKKNVHS
ncbi:four-jointed box protein 1-like X2 [Biomphalaria pfeifferi]|uniref:Four-jointed box protein 1-like X2 n=1 Tax=Biomphalaria pfeifferi TaxID=112525 RepID=A0AAD8F6R9_BIOPF|nr:four-jointed box protein 1-like X2 [Biomphalaria pfeifferi]